MIIISDNESTSLESGNSLSMRERAREREREKQLFCLIDLNVYKHVRFNVKKKFRIFHDIRKFSTKNRRMY